MRTLSIITLSIAALVALVSCENDKGPVMTSSPESPSITAPESGKNYTLTENRAGDTLFTVEWTEPDYGYPTAVEYAIQMAPAGSNFSEPRELATTTETARGFTVATLNSALLSSGFTAGQEQSVQFRVVANVTDSVESTITEPVTLAFTPYEVEISYPKIYVPGSYQAAGGYGSNWTPADAPALHSVEDDGVYEGYVYMPNGGNKFKFTPERGWDTAWGAGAGEGELNPSGGNIALPDSGYYRFTVDENNMTFDTLRTTTWGVIGGAADGWSSDRDMTYDSEEQVWEITTDLSAGEFKFRANDAWNLDYGDTGANGELNAGGDNIVLDEGGTYTIKLILSEPVYTYEIVPQ